MTYLRPLATSATNWSAPDEVLATDLGARTGWSSAPDGSIYDENELYVAATATEIAAAMRDLGWFVPSDARGSGIAWSKLPADNELADAVRKQLKQKN